MTDESVRRQDGWRLALDIAAVRDRPAGVGVYARSLAEGLAALIPDRLTVVGERAEAALNGRLPPSVGRLPFHGRSYQHWLHTRAAADARRDGARLVHYTNASAPLAVRHDPPFVLSVHDLSVLRMPHCPPLRRVATLPLSLVGIARAQAILVPSRATRGELARLPGASRRRVVVVEYAPAPGFSDDAGASSSDVRDRLGIADGHYLVAVGTLEPRKNHRRLIGAFERLAARSPDLRLVLVGGGGWRSAPILRRIADSPFRDRIVLAGYLATPDLAALMRGSAAVCYVSLYEGFGLPIVEAMVVGAPVVTSRASSMPEVAGGAAVLVDPLDEADISRGLAQAMVCREELVAAGRSRVGGRGWRDVAAETLDVYRWAMARVP